VVTDGAADDAKPVLDRGDRFGLNLEARLPKSTGDHLASLGHDVQWWPEFVWRAGAMCMIRTDPDTGLMFAGADPRRPCYAVGW
jgi:gamma-glutamyltranspeptidase/glutathione hydrolase